MPGAPHAKALDRPLASPFKGSTCEDEASPRSYDLSKILAEIDNFDFVKKLLLSCMSACLEALKATWNPWKLLFVQSDSLDCPPEALKLHR